jgi:Fe-S-cluster containining protein
MNFPAIAKQTYERLRSHEAFSFITDQLIAELKEIKNAIMRARHFHNRVDELTVDIFSHPIVQNLKGCKKGCSGCCHTEVSVTDDEAELLSNRIKNGINIDYVRLHTQKLAIKNGQNFYSIPFQMRACIFLNEDGHCKVYSDRPAVCRTNAVLGTSEQCSTVNGKVKPQTLIKTKEADMAIMGAFLVSNKSGVLADMVWDKLDKDNTTINPLINIKPPAKYDF